MLSTEPPERGVRDHKPNVIRLVAPKFVYWVSTTEFEAFQDKVLTADLEPYKD